MIKLRSGIGMALVTMIIAGGLGCGGSTAGTHPDAGKDGSTAGTGGGTAGGGSGGGGSGGGASAVRTSIGIAASPSTSLISNPCGSSRGAIA